MRTVEILEQARKLIETPETWWNGHGDQRHEQFCMIQATQHIDEDGAGYGADAALQRVAGDNLVHFNDSHTHAEVLAAFDKAIAELRAADPAKGTP